MAIQVITPFIYCAIKIYGTVNKVLSILAVRQRFSLFQKRSNFANLLELSDRDSVYLRSCQIFPICWNYYTEIQLNFRREMQKV